MGQVTHAQIFKVIEKWAPKKLAYNWDNIGLQIGTDEDTTKAVLVTLDVVESVVDEAIQTGANLIIAHHPLLFNPLQQIDVCSVKGKIIEKLIKHDITVYAAHTNLDIAKGGVNDLLCDKLQITDREHLLNVYSEKLYKLIVYVPQTHEKQVREVLGQAGAGHIGNYSHCAFTSKGEGTFRPSDGTNPFIGKVNEQVYVNETKIEVIIEAEKTDDILSVLFDVHPYEEVAYDLFPLKNEGTSYGLGKIGNLPKEMTLNELCQHVKQSLDLPALRVVGHLNKKVKKVAVLGGSGEKYYDVAHKRGADVYITGDMTFHQAQDAEQSGLSIIDPGHYIEAIMVEATVDYLQNKCQEVNVIGSNINTNPFQFN